MSMGAAEVDLAEPALTRLEELYRGFVANLPLIVVALVIGLIGIALGWLLAAAVRRGLSRTSADSMAVGIAGRIVRLAVVIGAALFALSVAGVEVGAALAGLGIAGLAVALALQGILENFIAGIILLIRKPFRVGDQVRTNEFEGTVTDLDLRVTKLLDYDGELVLIPNTLVYTSPLVNLTRRGARRTRVVVGVDYRDDHDASREVIRAAVAAVEGVLAEPAPEVLLMELGESSVNFEVRYWTLPDIRSVRHTQDRVLGEAKRAIADAGMTIPWPIRTLVLDAPLRIERD
ncbi:MAG: mechanosensitive ion channel family protein [Euzebyaceae bacterium]|nr:mechanosensitive ion channel family protein [Euzebyaceae bacterium]